MINLHERMLLNRHGLNPQLDHQSDAQPAEPPRPADLPYTKYLDSQSQANRVDWDQISFSADVY